MTNHNEPNELPPINEHITRDIFDDLCHDIEQLKRSVMRLADYSAMIELPEPEPKTRLTQAIMDLIAATAEATHKLHHHQARHKGATTANPPSSTPLNQNAPDRTKPHLRLRTPTTVQIEDHNQS